MKPPDMNWLNNVLSRAALHGHAAWLAIFEFAPFVTPVLLVLAVHAWFQLDTSEFWFIPEWWVAIVFMLFEIQRDGMRTLKPQLKGLDGIALFSVIGSLLLISTVFLVFVIAHGKKPTEFPIPPWLNDAQKAFLAISFFTFFFTKYLIKKEELITVMEDAVDPFEDAIVTAGTQAAAAEVERLIKNGETEKLKESTELFRKLFGGKQ